MSTFAGRLESTSALRAETVLDRRLTRYLIAIVGLLSGVGACILVATKVPEEEIVARVRAMIERERSATDRDLETS